MNSHHMKEIRKVFSFVAFLCSVTGNENENLREYKKNLNKNNNGSFEVLFDLNLGKKTPRCI